MKCIGSIIEKTRANSMILLTSLLYPICTKQPVAPHTINLPMKIQKNHHISVSIHCTHTLSVYSKVLGACTSEVH
jgi:hypothetical protein